MEKAEPSSSWTSKLLTLTICTALMSGCAGSARNLPSDYGSVDAEETIDTNEFSAEMLRATCQEIQTTLHELKNQISIHEQGIKDKRHQNQVAGYIGVFFLPAWLITDGSHKEKKSIKEINEAKDLLYKLQAFKKCPS